MNSITLRLSDDENKLIRDFAKAKNITISELMRQSVLEKIEDEIDLKIYNQAMREHKKDLQDISFAEMMNELGFDE